MSDTKLKFRGLAVASIKGLCNWVYGSDIRINYQKKLAFIGGSEVLFDTVGQFIGTTDKEQTEIYEGDLLDIHNGATEDYKHFLAQVHRHGASFNLAEPIYFNTIIAQPVPHFINQTGVIRGNIHEHKDLITQWKNEIKIENAKRF